MNSKFKIALVAVFVVLIIGLAYVFRDKSGQNVVKGEVPYEGDPKEMVAVEQDKKGEESKAAPMPGQISSHLRSNTGEDRVLSDEELEELDRYFDQVEKDWDQSMESLFLKELALPQEEFKEYKKLREAYEMDRLEAYHEFHEYMLEKYGEKYTYSPSDDMEKFENKVREQYLEVLRKRIGDDNFKKYIETMDQFNEKLRREQDPYKGVMIIDF
ncbi:MAG: hypothetical protein Fur0010_13660 [Bdellovibrio sp.]